MLTVSPHSLFLFVDRQGTDTHGQAPEKKRKEDLGSLYEIKVNLKNPETKLAVVKEGVYMHAYVASVLLGYR